MPEERFIDGRRYVISNEAQVALTPREWNLAKERYRKFVARKLAEQID